MTCICLLFQAVSGGNGEAHGHPDTHAGQHAGRRPLGPLPRPRHLPAAPARGLRPAGAPPAHPCAHARNHHVLVIEADAGITVVIADVQLVDILRLGLENVKM